jgi:hypothetical protein
VQDRGDSDADDDEPEALDAAPVGQQVDGARAQETAGDRAARRGEVRVADERDHDEGAGVRAGGEADDVGRAERIAGERLEDRPRKRESRAEDERDEHARQPPLEHDGGVESTVAREHRPHHLDDAQRVVAGAERDEGEHDDREPEGTDHEQLPARHDGADEGKTNG